LEMKPREKHNSLQELVIKPSNVNGMYNIRFDKHPQPYVFANNTDEKVYMQDSNMFGMVGDINENSQWQIMVHGKKKQKDNVWKFKEPRLLENSDLPYSVMEDNSLMVMIYNPRTRLFLAHSNSSVGLHRPEQGQYCNSSSITWILDCVGHFLSATQVGVGILGFAFIGLHHAAAHATGLAISHVAATHFTATALAHKSAFLAHHQLINVFVANHSTMVAHKIATELTKRVFRLAGGGILEVFYPGMQGELGIGIPLFIKLIYHI